MYLNSGISEFKDMRTCWTLTWDVFKLKIKNDTFYSVMGWTLTWDVFKFTC